MVSREDNSIDSNYGPLAVLGDEEGKRKNFHFS